MRKACFILALFCLFLLSGCASAPKDPGSVRLEPVVSRLKDIPVPKSFEYIKDGSYYLDSGISGVRLGTIRYQGNALLDKVKDFYAKEMPRYKWVLANTLEYGPYMLHFSRDNENCLIYLSEENNLVNIVINLGPKIEKLLK